MIRNCKPLCFSYEYGDQSLPRLKDMVSPQPDACKSLILDYLRENYTLGCPGIVQDILQPDCVIGDGSLYSDDCYYWPDYFANYVEKYNIPVPPEFREHIINNHSRRKELHLRHSMIKKIVIRNNPRSWEHYCVVINENGGAEYCDSIDCHEPVVYILKPEDAKWIIGPITRDLFCYDMDNHGCAVIDGYHWKIEYYSQKKCEKTGEGWPGEDPWRHNEIKKILLYIKRFIPRDMGTQLM